MKPLGLSLCCTLALLAASGSPARAELVLLTPGSTVSLTGGTTATDLAGYTLVTKMAFPLTGDLQDTVTVNEAVFRNTTNGTLIFAYQETVTGPDSKTSLSMSSFANFATSVDYLTDGGPSGAGFTTGSVASTAAFRSASPGADIQFAYAGPLVNGATGDILLVATNAAAYDTAGTLFSSGAGPPNDSSSSFEPVGPAVPEPGSLVLVGTGLALVGLAARARRFAGSISVS